MTSEFKSTGGIKRIFNAANYSRQGLIAAFKHEAAFRQELLLCLILLPLSFLVGSTWLERLWLIGTLFIVLIAELINSAIEALADAITTEHHPLIERAKDIASAAVMLALILTGLSWILILLQRLSLL